MDCLTNNENDIINDKCMKLSYHFGCPFQPKNGPFSHNFDDFKAKKCYRCQICNIAVHRECIQSAGNCSPFSCNLLHSSHNNLSPLFRMDELLRDHLWFAETMDREKATRELEHKRVGTYLLRIRPTNSDGGESRYALSLKTSDTVRHMRVFNKKVDDTEQFYLSEARFFKTVLDLVNFYEKNTLRENYERLSESAKLLWPFKQLDAEAIGDWMPSLEDTEQIPLKVGCKVIILDKPNSDNWWKGLSMNKVGYFPKQYVRLLGELREFD